MYKIKQIISASFALEARFHAPADMARDALC